MTIEVRDNPGQSRYELRIDERLVGVADYTRRGTIVDIPHTEIDPARRRRGLGAQLVGGALDLLRAEGVEVVPTCPFVARFIDEHPEYQDLLADRSGE